MPGIVLILAGGTAPDPHLVGALTPVDLCIAADSGLDRARALGLVPDLVVGDLDSVSADGLAWAEARGVAVERHPVDKDQTDLEIALVRAVALRPARVLVAAIGGGRLDHLLANLAVLADRRWAAVPVAGLVGRSTVAVVHGGAVHPFGGEPGELVSLLPVHGDAIGVTTTGLRWPLGGETLPAGTTRGVSNELVDRQATVTLRRGTLLVVRPELDIGGSEVG